MEERVLGDEVRETDPRELVHRITELENLLRDSQTSDRKSSLGITDRENRCADLTEQLVDTNLGDC